jgi:hypothetical protein
VLKQVEANPSVLTPSRLPFSFSKDKENYIVDYNIKFISMSVE